MRALNTSRTFLILLIAGCACVAVAANLGPDDQQVSVTGAAGTAVTDAFSPAVAYAPGGERYLTVWSADETDGDFQIEGQLLTGAGGVAIGPQFAIGPAVAVGTDQRQPAVAYDPVREQFLVVWSGDDGNPGAYEIQGRLVTLGGQVSGPAVRLSDMGNNDADPTFDAVTPDVGWHAGLNAFVVVWAGDDDTGALSDGRFELYGQLVAPDGSESGANDFRVSFAGPDAHANDALRPSLAVMPGPNRWFVAFEGDFTSDAIHEPEVLIYGGTADVPDQAAFLVSQMGADIFDSFNGRNPDLAWSASTGELVCVWDGNEPGLPQAIYGQRLLPDGTPVGGRLDLSTSAAQGGPLLREAAWPSIAIDPQTNEWVVAWRGDLNDGLAQYDHEIWTARFDDTGASVVPDAFALSAMDPLLSSVPGTGRPALAVNSDFGSKLVAWSGERDVDPNDGREIYSQAWTDDFASAVDETPGPTGFALRGAAPNPFNPMTTIAFDLPNPVAVSLRVYDTSGRLVRTLLADDVGTAGRNEVIWNGQDNAGRQAASGVYFYRLETPVDQGHGRMTLIK